MTTTYGSPSWIRPAEHTTAGLDMPKFFGPTATAKPIPKDQVDPFALQRRTTKPVISVVHGFTYTIGIEMMLAGDIVIAADTADSVSSNRSAELRRRLARISAT